MTGARSLLIQWNGWAGIVLKIRAVADGRCRELIELNTAGSWMSAQTPVKPGKNVSEADTH